MQIIPKIQIDAYLGQTRDLKPQEILPNTEICSVEVDDHRLAKYGELCGLFEARLRTYVGDNPIYAQREFRHYQVRQTISLLENFNTALHEGNIESVEKCAKLAAGSLQNLFLSHSSELEVDAEIYQDFNQGVVLVRNVIAIAGMSIVGAELFAGAIWGISIIGGPVVVGGTGAASYGTLSFSQLAETSPILSSTLPIFKKAFTPLQSFYISSTSYIQNLITQPLYRLEGLKKLIPWMKEPTLNGLNQSVMRLYAWLRITNALVNIAKDFTVEKQGVASIPGEEVFGKESRLYLGPYGIFSIGNEIGMLKFGYSAESMLFFVLGLLINEMRVQYNSSGLTLDNADWARMDAAATTALLSIGPMNLLWNGAGVWVGWNNIIGLPKPLAVGGFLMSSAIINTLLIRPLCMIIERSNYWNFWAGLTIREFTVSTPRKVLQAILNPNSKEAMVIYFISKYFENDFISRFYSLFAGTGTYREPMHNFLSKDHDTNDFIAHSQHTLGSLSFSIKDNQEITINPYYNFRHELEEDDYALIGIDIAKGEFSENELKRIISHVDFILSNISQFDEDSIEVALGWLVAFRISSELKPNNQLTSILNKHKAHIDFIDLNISFSQQVDVINE